MKDIELCEVFDGVFDIVVCLWGALNVVEDEIVFPVLDEFFKVCHKKTPSEVYLTVKKIVRPSEGVKRGVGSESKST